MGDRAAAFANLPKPSSENEEKDAVMLNEWGNLDNDIRIKLIKGRLKKDCKMKVVIPAPLESMGILWVTVKRLRVCSKCIPRQRKLRTVG